jgi:hypothetical protein
MPPGDKQRELGLSPRALDIADSHDAAREAALSDGALAELLREQPTVGVAALYDRYGRLVFSLALRIETETPLYGRPEPYIVARPSSMSEMP